MSDNVKRAIEYIELLLKDKHFKKMRNKVALEYILQILQMEE